MTHDKKTRATVFHSTLCTALLVALGVCGMSGCATKATLVPAPLVDTPKASGPLQTAVLAGGCFWGVEAVFEHVVGVRDVLSGYAGGTLGEATYSLVSSGRTRHAEAVQIVFDPQEISYGEILRIYFAVAHDPTQRNRQGPDVGPQYRSAIFYVDELQKKIAADYISQLTAAQVFARTIATEVTALPEFYPAEYYHQDYLLRNPYDPYIVVHDKPKLRRLQQTLPTYYRDERLAGTLAADAKPAAH